MSVVPVVAFFLPVPFFVIPFPSAFRRYPENKLDLLTDTDTVTT